MSVIGIKIKLWGEILSSKGLLSYDTHTQLRLICEKITG